jgi:hypothetical protein
MARANRLTDNSNTAKSTYVLQQRVFSKEGHLLSEATEEDTIAVHSFITTPAEIGVTLGGTINLGNFESARLDITCKIPAYREEIAEAYEYAFKFADERLNEQLKKMLGAAKERTSQDFSPF